MAKKILFIPLILALLAAFCTQPTTEPGEAEAAGPAEAFETAGVRFETNATDGDVEVVFEVKAGDAGLLKLKIVSPGGRTVVDFTAPDASTLGIRQFQMESPEPADVASLKAAYPEGTYQFSGTDAEGTRFAGEATLSHQLPATASFQYPVEEAEDVPFEALVVTWPAIPNMAGYIVEIEQDELEVNVTARLPGNATSFAVPPGFLQAGTEYALAIGTVMENGNLSFVETSFTTAGDVE
jgi:hypothetical protein